MGAPTYNGNPASKMLSWAERTWESAPPPAAQTCPWPTLGLGCTNDTSKQKFGAVFTTSGNPALGAEHALASLTRLLWTYQFQVVVPSPAGAFHTYGAVAATLTTPFDQAGGEAWNNCKSGAKVFENFRIPPSA